MRPPAVAGLFYPSEPDVLRRGVLDAIALHGPLQETPKAVVAPHAGHRFSGAIAGAAFATLAPGRDRIRRVVVVGPSHRVAFDGVAVPSVDAFVTPLGELRIDDELRAAALGSPFAGTFDIAHRDEHSLEVLLPFVQEALGEVAVLPLVVGRAPAETVADVLERVWGGAETAIVISSDLSHYHDYDEANRRDDLTEERILALDLEHIGGEDACGARPLAGMLLVARRLGLPVVPLARCNSGDTPHGDRDRVVGYGAWAFPATSEVSSRVGADTEDALFVLAWDAIRSRLDAGDGGAVPSPSESPGASRFPQRVARELARRQGCFVTLHSGGALRGCVGGLEHHFPLGEAVRRFAQAAAFGDRRFQALRSEEWAGLEMDISLLGPIERLFVADEAELAEVLEPGLDGLLLASGRRRGTFLPTVWEQLPEPTAFIRGAKVKAGLHPDDWPADLTVHRYRTHLLGPRRPPA